MNQTTFEKLERYMQTCMQDSAHDKEHVYRVLYLALDIAQTEPETDLDTLITACLLHDICRAAQYANPAICHAAAGAEQARQYLLAEGFDPDFSQKVAACIRCHRFRKHAPPESLEAKILFDADKLDVTGAMGIARTLLYQGKLNEPLYSMLPDGSVSDGVNDSSVSFFQEYHFKLKNLYDRFYTARGRQLAISRRQSAEAFYQQLLEETRQSYASRRDLLSFLTE